MAHAPQQAGQHSTLPSSARPAKRALAAVAALAMAMAAPLPAALLAGRAGAEEAIRAEYRCLGRFDASDVTALFFRGHPAEVVLIEGEQARRLPQVMAASGARYSDGRDSFWVKGEQASWSLGKGPPRRCEPRR